MDTHKGAGVWGGWPGKAALGMWAEEGSRGRAGRRMRAGLTWAEEPSGPGGVFSKETLPRPTWVPRRATPAALRQAAGVLTRMRQQHAAEPGQSRCVTLLML